MNRKTIKRIKKGVMWVLRLIRNNCGLIGGIAGYFWGEPMVHYIIVIIIK